MNSVDAQEFKVSVGDILQVGDCTVAIIDIDGQNISFRIDGCDHEDSISVDEFEWAVPPGK